MIITINNWDNFQLRKDVKSSSWFRFEHNFFTDHKFFVLTNDEKIVWLNILCTASIESKSEIEYNLELAHRLTNVDKRQLGKILQKLEQLQCITITSRTRTVHDTYTCLQTDRQTDKQTVVFDLENIYKNYPKKQGKKKGIEKLSKIIKTQELYEKILQASKDYTEYHKIKETELQYIKQFSTWVNGEHWNDEINISQVETFDPFADKRLSDEYKNEV